MNVGLCYQLINFDLNWSIKTYEHMRVLHFNNTLKIVFKA